MTEQRKPIDTVLVGDAGLRLAELPSNFIHCIVTSPPYYGQRDYGQRGQVGAESTVKDYIDSMRRIFREAYRVLRDDGTLWLNIGDKYIDGTLQGIPWRVALGLVEDGWLLRSDIVWHKPNAMPHSAATRPTPDHEYMFFLTKSKSYYYDADSIREEHVTFSQNSRMRGGRNHFGKRNGTPEKGKNAGNQNLHDSRWDQAFHPKGRNKRTVWSVPLSKFRGAHFAVFPERLIDPCIRAGCPTAGIVLDPFIGSGTTALVAKRLGRHYLGIDLHEEYADMARARVAEWVESDLFDLA